MNCNQWIFDMDGTLTDSMTAVWENAPLALLRRYGRTPRADLRSTLLSMGMADGAQVPHPGSTRCPCGRKTTSA